ncbi:MAG: rhodanese-like domain-containing protein [Candidatus Adiutrix sp.]
MGQIIITGFLALFILVLVFAGGRLILEKRAANLAAVNTKITAQAAHKIMNGDEPVILIDVRTASEYDEGHIEGAILIPHQEIEQKIQLHTTDKDGLILLYCRSGRRSAIATKMLLNMGYNSVFDFGSISDWPFGLSKPTPLLH